MKIAIIGTGNLGGAIANGLITNNAITSLYLTKRNVNGLSAFEGYKNVISLQIIVKPFRNLIF